MSTHQELAGVSDEDLVNRMISSHGDRFDPIFWDYFADQVAPHMPPEPTMIDVGCGPGLLLRDLRERFADASLWGYDITAAMLDYGRNKVSYEGATPHFQHLDIATQPVPMAAGSVNLLTMVAVLHVLPDPLKVCVEICRVLADDGVFLLQDWIRTPLPVYLERMISSDLPAEQQAAMRSAMFRLFPAHNKYTIDDWLWVLQEGGLRVLNHQQLRSPHFCAFVCMKA
jgi:SAM-dependent methyltransferase